MGKTSTRAAPAGVSSTDFLDLKMEYIHLNPVRAKIVADSMDYLYNSASDFARTKGLVTIEFVQ